MVFSLQPTHLSSFTISFCILKLIKNDEEKHHPVPESSGVEMLQFFMNEHGLSISDLKEIGSPDTVPEILDEFLYRVRMALQEIAAKPGNDNRKLTVAQKSTCLFGH